MLLRFVFGAVLLLRGCVLARLVINEVSPAGAVHGPCNGGEFIEVRNLGTSAVNLTSHWIVAEFALPCEELSVPNWQRNTDPTYNYFFWAGYYAYAWDYDNAYYEDYTYPEDASFAGDDEECWAQREVVYHIFRYNDSHPAVLGPDDRQVECIPYEVQGGWDDSYFYSVPLFWQIVQFGWPLSLKLYAPSSHRARHLAASEYDYREGSENASVGDYSASLDYDYNGSDPNAHVSRMLLDRTGRLLEFPSGQFDFKSKREVFLCGNAMASVEFSEIYAEYKGFAWARVPDGTGNVTIVGRATPGQRNTVCLFPETCQDCASLSIYRHSARRCVCPPGTRLAGTDPLECVSCEAGEFSAGDDEIACVCAKGYFWSNPLRCRPCLWPHTTATSGAESSEECIVDWLLVAPYAMALCGIIVVLVLLGAYFRLRNLRRSLADRKMHEDLAQGLAAIQSPQYPFCLISLVDFCNMSNDDLGYCHEGARDAGQLLSLDSRQSIEGFKSLGHKVLFFSYTWTSWEKLGPDSMQAACMKEAAKHICAEHAIDPEHFFVWLDVLGIPQANNFCKALAVNSLYVYASSADFLVVICPPSVHEQTGEIVDAAAYKARVWCRVEQVAHCLSHGFGTMYVSTAKGKLEKVDEDWINDALHIFEGDVTCCRLRHPNDKKCDKKLLVPTVLAMYADMLAKVNEDGSVDGPEDLQTVWDMMCADRSRVFPRQFTYVKESGKRCQKRLFGTTIEWLHKSLAHKKGLSLVADPKASSLKDSATTVDTSPASFKFAQQAVSQHLRTSHGARRISRGSSTQLFAAQSQQQLRRRGTADLAAAVAKGSSDSLGECLENTARPDSMSIGVGRHTEPEQLHVLYPTQMSV
eukprot:TRINITY_DN26743_c0_g3_i1.p1 TRINITY_DN26743_c0_g3~~TRINITY_DN26743_c0_g3_i1.p1  ORF type:complete len:866 (+),score=65.20 TRINITY_DN26743_c0_g3_i1:113-2710(+)